MQKFYENGEPTRRGLDGGIFLDTPTRTKIDLAGTWRYTRDGERTWNVVQIPSCYDFTGPVTFVRSFSVDERLLDAAAFKLVVYGVNYECEIYVNDVYVGKHAGGYTSFAFPVPQNTLQVGPDNAIKVIVDNTLNSRDTLPLRQQVWGWRNYGGIFRDIYILATPRVWVEEITLSADIRADFRLAQVSVRALIHNRDYIRSDFESLQADVPQPPTFSFYVEAQSKLSGSTSAKSQPVPLRLENNTSTEVEAEFTIRNPELWSPGLPDMYLIRCFIVSLQGGVSSIVDEFDLNYGVRTVELKDGYVVLNGKRIVLKGVVWQEDHSTFGSAMTYESLEKDIVMIKSLGANLIRFGNHSPHPYVLNLCDRYGLLVMEEVPAWNVPADILGTDYYIEIAQTYAREMITRDRHHPSVLAWGIGDDLDSSEDAACAYVTSLSRYVKSVDPRPVYYASRLIDNEACMNGVDIAAVNLYTRDPKEFSRFLERWKTNHAGKPIIIAKYGYHVEPDNRNGFSDPLSMESQAKYLRETYDEIKQANIAGSILWTYNDWRGERPALTAYSGDPYLHSVGLVSYGREKRIAYSVVRALFNDEKITALPIGSYSRSAPIVYVLAGLFVLISFFYFYNRNKRFRENVHRSLMRSYNFFADIRDQRFISYVETSLIGLFVSITLAIVVSSVLLKFRESLALDYLLTHVLVFDSLKEKAVYLIWNPVEGILYFSVLFFAGLFIMVGVIKVFSVFAKMRIFLFHAYSVTVWAALPVVLFIPVATLLYRIMEREVYVVPTLLIFAILLAWVFFRTLKGISIIYDVIPVKVYASGLVISVGFLAMVFGYYDYTQSTGEYIKLMVNVVNSTK
ncbi:MAG: glycoside hydrolase family 2 TIM barrel-domain containing protein [Bacteroidota bacterium]